MNVIPIVPATLDIIEELNGGVRPELEDQETFFVYKGKNEHAEIIHRDGFEKLPDYWTIVKVLYRNVE